VAGKIALGILAGMLLALGGYAFVYAKGYSYLSNNPTACANCHAMGTQYEAWIKSSHHSAATCNDCHTPHNLTGSMRLRPATGSLTPSTSRPGLIQTIFASRRST
jgi:cytochrome c nitrite reductase small subunit